MMDAMMPDKPSHVEITAVYYVAKEFGLDPGEILKWPATRFTIILEEMHKSHEEERKALKMGRFKNIKTFGR
jgi:hypothetical protein